MKEQKKRQKQQLKQIFSSKVSQGGKHTQQQCRDVYTMHDAKTFSRANSFLPELLENLRRLLHPTFFARPKSNHGIITENQNATKTQRAILFYRFPPHCPGAVPGTSMERRAVGRRRQGVGRGEGREAHQGAQILRLSNGGAAHSTSTHLFAFGLAFLSTHGITSAHFFLIRVQGFCNFPAVGAACEEW